MSSTAQTSELVTAREAAVILGRSVRTVQRMADTGQLRVAHRNPGPNGALLFGRAAVEALADATPARRTA